MFNFSKNKEMVEEPFIKITALLIHAAKIDQNYSLKEREIIKKAIAELGVTNDKLENILIKAEEIEKNSNQILDFTKKVKNMNENNKIKIVESLWKIIYSDKEADIYEANLMRRLAGLLYIDSKIMGDIKEKIKTESLK